jgi:hypothetical protein
MIRICVATAHLFLAVALATAEPSKPVELTGVITQMKGAVSLAGPGVGPVPLASLWQVIRAGVTVRLPEGAAVGIACSNRRFVRLRGPGSSWSLSAQSCAAGKELTPAEYALVAPQAGRFKVVHDLLLLDREMRPVVIDDPLAPVVLTPRNTQRSPRPTVSWLPLPSATEFNLEWTGPRGTSYSRRLDAATVSCAAEPGGLEVCSVPWPADRADLPPGEIFYLTVAAREGIVEPWHGAETVELSTPSLAETAKLEGSLQSLKSLGLTGALLATAEAGLFAEAGLYSEAAASYRKALEAAPAPELRVTLADLYLTIGLFRFAEPLYRGELTAEAPAVRAAALFGYGRLEYALNHFKEAAERFRQAGELYRGLNLSEEETAARKAVKRAIERVPPEPPGPLAIPRLWRPVRSKGRPAAARIPSPKSSGSQSFAFPPV